MQTIIYTIVILASSMCIRITPTIIYTTKCKKDNMSVFYYLLYQLF